MFFTEFNLLRSEEPQNWLLCYAYSCPDDEDGTSLWIVGHNAEVLHLVAQEDLSVCMYTGLQTLISWSVYGFCIYLVLKISVGEVL